MRVPFLVVMTFFLLSVISCGNNAYDIAVDSVKKGNGDKVFAHAAEFTLSVDDLKREYEAYVRSYFPRSLWNNKLKDKQAMRAYGEKIAIQYLLIGDLLKSAKLNKEDVNLLLMAALRSALAEIYLRSKADLSPIVGSKAFRSMNEKMVEKLYKKNKSKYDKKKINKKRAMHALRYVLVQKKKQLLERYLYRKRLVIIQQLIKKQKYDIKKDALQ